jgi:hypothetical protein
MKKKLSIAFLMAGGIPLAVYPIVALASIMSLAGHRSGTEPFVLGVAATAAQLSSLLYPVAYLTCLFVAIGRLRKDEPALRLSALPLVYLVVVVGLFSLWIALEGGAQGPP